MLPQLRGRFPRLCAAMIGAHSCRGEKEVRAVKSTELELRDYKGTVNAMQIPRVTVKIEVHTVTPKTNPGPDPEADITAGRQPRVLRSERVMDDGNL